MADPDFPAGVSFGHVVGRWIEAVGDGPDGDTEPDAVPLDGSVIFTPSVAGPGVVKIGSVGMVVRPVTVPIVAGVLDCWLVASDDPDINPTGWTWQADIRFNGGGTYKFSFSLAAGADVDLILATAVPGTGGQWITQGPAGPSAYDTAVAEGFVGTEAEWIDSLHGLPGADSTVPGPPGAGVAAGGATGQVLAKTSGADYATGWTNPPQTTPTPDVQTYQPTGTAGSQTTYTWTKPPGARMVHILAWASGGGGGSGRRGAAGTVRCGGGGGGAGGVINISIPADLLPASMPVKVGKGGAGGAAVTTDDTNGNTGSANGGHTQVGNMLATSGGPGGGGTAAAGAAGSGQWGYSNVVASPNGGAASTTGAAGAAGGGAGNFWGLLPTGGGAGGGLTSGNAQSAGGAGGGNNPGNTGGTTPAAGTAGGGNGGAGQPTIGVPNGLGGGGGGSSLTTPGGAGGTGGNYGAGGGGGGASVNGQPSGAGGNGGDGIATIITTF